MNAKRCLSFQTQDKGMMDLEFRKKIKTVIYGCDICQISCPYNKGLDNPLATEIDPDLAHPELIPFIELSNGQFKEKNSGTLLEAGEAKISSSAMPLSH